MAARFGSSVLIPPHNEVAADVADAVLKAGFHVCRSLRDNEVEGLGISLGRRIDRGEAKRLYPYHRRGN